MSTPPAPPQCPRCGATYGPDQEYCLECGQRLRPAGGVFGRLAGAWQRKFSWYPGDWIWSVLLFTYHSYHSHRTVPLTREALTILRVVIVGNVLLATAAYLLPLRQLSRTWFVLFAVLSAEPEVQATATGRHASRRSALQSVGWGLLAVGASAGVV